MHCSSTWFVLSDLWEERGIPCWKPVWVDLCSRCTLDWPDAHTHTRLCTLSSQQERSVFPVSTGNCLIKLYQQYYIETNHTTKYLADKIVFGSGNCIIIKCTLCTPIALSFCKNTGVALLLYFHHETSLFSYSIASFVIHIGHALFLLSTFQNEWQHVFVSSSMPLKLR